MTTSDDTLDGLRDAWRTGRDSALMAYRSWMTADPSEWSDAYAAYLAASDREAAAADAYLRAATAT